MQLFQFSNQENLVKCTRFFYKHSVFLCTKINEAIPHIQINVAWNQHIDSNASLFSFSTHQPKKVEENHFWRKLFNRIFISWLFTSIMHVEWWWSYGKYNLFQFKLQLFFRRLMEEIKGKMKGRKLNLINIFFCFF